MLRDYIYIYLKKKHVYYLIQGTWTHCVNEYALIKMLARAQDDACLFLTVIEMKGNLYCLWTPRLRGRKWLSGWRELYLARLKGGAAKSAQREIRQSRSLCGKYFVPFVSNDPPLRRLSLCGVKSRKGADALICVCVKIFFFPLHFQS